MINRIAAAAGNQTLTTQIKPLYTESCLWRAQLQRTPGYNEQISVATNPYLQRLCFACIISLVVNEPCSCSHRGFVEEFQLLVKWASDFRYPPLHTEINFTVLKGRKFQVNRGAKKPGNNYTPKELLHVLSGWVDFGNHSSTLILTCLWTCKRVLTKFLRHLPFMTNVFAHWLTVKGRSLPKRLSTIMNLMRTWTIGTNCSDPNGELTAHGHQTQASNKTPAHPKMEWTVCCSLMSMAPALADLKGAQGRWAPGPKFLHFLAICG